MKTNSQKPNWKLWVGVMIGIVLVVLFAQPRTASGQPWTGPDGSGNVWNANTGNVGVGTNTPDRLFTVQGALPSFSTPLSVFRTTGTINGRSEEHTSELQSHLNLVCRLLLEK